MSKTQNKERPILFSGPMVRAIRAGRKTVTRRVLKPQPPEGWEPEAVERFCPAITCADGMMRDGKEIFGAWGEEWGIACPYGGPGDRLWVRETFLYRAARKAVIYRADFDSAEAAGVWAMYGGWKPSIFMPRKFSRLTLEIGSVRVERLQAITDQEAELEGFTGHYSPAYCVAGEICGPDGQTTAEEFRELWGQLNGVKHPWESNPWVWRVEFKIVEGQV